jgi:hypothetical protein
VCVAGCKCATFEKHGQQHDHHLLIHNLICATVTKLPTALDAWESISAVVVVLVWSGFGPDIHN